MDLIKSKELRKSLFTNDNELYTDKRMDTIKKAFEAGTGITPQTQPDGAAYRMESLDPTVNITTWGADDYTILNDIARQNVEQTVNKYIVYYNHGMTGHSLFQPEIAIPQVNTPNSKQETVSMKFIVDTKASSFAMQWAQTTVDTNRILEISGINTVSKTIEWALFYGNADLSADGNKDNGLEFNGLAKLIDSDNVMDARARALTPSLLNAAAVKIGHGFGVATNAYMPLGVKADFVNKFLPAQRVLVPSGNGTDMQVGFNIAQFISARGTIKLSGSTIMDSDNILDLQADVRPNAPVPPTVTVAEDKTVDTGKFIATAQKDEDGNTIVPAEVGADLTYRVVAVGKADSVPSDPVSVNLSAATSGVKVTMTFNRLAGSLPDYVAVYRQSLFPNDNGFYLIKRIPLSEMDASTGAITFEDVDDVVAGTADVFIGDNRPETIQLLEFAPLTKFNLATVTTATNFAILWYGALQLPYPKRWVQIKNVLYNSVYEDLKLV